MTRLAPGTQARSEKGWLAAYRWLILRRVVQLGILALFLAGPLAGVWIVKGTLASSVTLDVLPLTDPYLVLQSLAAGHVPYVTALMGAAIVLAFYLLAGGRVYCSWVCPVNIVTDTAAWLRRRLGLASGRTPPERLRYWLLGATLAGSYATTTILWEWINPVTLFYRGLLYGAGLAWLVVLAVFLFDLFIAPRGWCGHVCPVGAFYAVLGRVALPRVSAWRRESCNDCMDCFAVCPEPRVISPALKPKAGGSPVILAAECTNCARCIDVCSRNVFRFTTRFDHRSAPT